MWSGGLKGRGLSEDLKEMEERAGGKSIPEKGSKDEILLAQGVARAMLSVERLVELILEVMRGQSEGWGVARPQCSFWVRCVSSWGFELGGVGPLLLMQTGLGAEAHIT